MNNCKNIIFDLGGVLLTLDYQKTEDAFINLGMQDFPKWYKQDYSSALFEHLETGLIDAATFYDGLRKASGLMVEDAVLRDAWNAMLGYFPPERLQWLDAIGRRYRIFLFSNTNSIHYDAFMQSYAALNMDRLFNDYFIKAYYSQQMGLRKPHVAAYNYILEEQGLTAGETLMIDDTLKNIEGARAAGLQTIHLQAPLTVLDLDL